MNMKKSYFFFTFFVFGISEYFYYFCKKKLMIMMNELRYPIGMQTFSQIIEEGYAYVDKTAYIKPLLNQGKFIFLSRPRRFGKSLLLSTLKAYFEGRRDLFKGLAADSMELDWTPSPVLRFDLNAENFSLENGLVSLLNRLLGEYEKLYGITVEADTLAGRFSQLIRKVAESTGRKVVILIDEYDKPLLEIEHNKELFEKNQRIQKRFLARRVKALGTFPADINGQRCSREELIAVGLNDSNPIPLMFQTGYLTIRDYDKEMKLYEMRFPNREVEIGFYQQLLPLYVPEVNVIGSPFRFSQFKMDLYEGRPQDFMKRLATLLKDLPGKDHCESAYRAITYLLAVLCGTQAIAEHDGYQGRSDIEAMTSKYIYVFEFKYNRSVDEAMDQIHSRDYAGRYAMDGRTVYLIGANFNEKKDRRGLEYKIVQ